MCESNKRAFVNKNKRFYAFCEHFEDAILCLPEHLFSLAFISFKTLKYLYFLIFFNKKSRTFMDQNQFQVLSRPWNWTSEIQGFSRVFKTHTNPKESRSLIIFFLFSWYSSQLFGQAALKLCFLFGWYSSLPSDNWQVTIKYVNCPAAKSTCPGPLDCTNR